MNPPKWQKRASIIWAIDAVFVALECLALILTIVGVAVVTSLKDYPDSFLRNHILPLLHNMYYVIGMWLVLGLWTGCCLIRVCSSWKLYVATREYCDPEVAARNAYYWINVIVFFLLLYILEVLLQLLYGIDHVVADLGILLVVVRYILEITVIIMYRNEMVHRMGVQSEGKMILDASAYV